jgi:hypothetical protein
VPQVRTTAKWSPIRHLEQDFRLFGQVLTGLLAAPMQRSGSEDLSQ